MNQHNINAVDAQHLTICMLNRLSEMENIRLLEKVEKSPEYNKDIQKHLFLCAGVVEEAKLHPECYGTLESICRAILTRQKNKASVLKKDYRDALGLKNNMELSRLEKGETILKMEHVQNICGGFEEEYNRRFWENQLLYWYPSIDASQRANEIESACLNAVYHALTKEQYDTIYAGLSELERTQLDTLFQDSPKELPKMGEPPYQLYKIIGKQANDIGKSIAIIAEEELGITTNTWYIWKKKWAEAEQNSFLNGIPKLGISRVQLMMLVVLFDFTYFESVVFLALAGYRFANGEPDMRVIHYLNNKETESAEDIKKYLKDGLFYDRWLKR